MLTSGVATLLLAADGEVWTEDDKTFFVWDSNQFEILTSSQENGGALTAIFYALGIDTPVSEASELKMMICDQVWADIPRVTASIKVIISKYNLNTCADTTDIGKILLQWEEDTSVTVYEALLLLITWSLGRPITIIDPGNDVSALYSLDNSS